MTSDVLLLVGGVAFNSPTVGSTVCELLSYLEGVKPADLISTSTLQLLCLRFVAIVSGEGGVNIGPANLCAC